MVMRRILNEAGGTVCDNFPFGAVGGVGLEEADHDWDWYKGRLDVPTMDANLGSLRRHRCSDGMSHPETETGPIVADVDFSAQKVACASDQGTHNVGRCGCLFCGVSTDRKRPELVLGWCPSPALDGTPHGQCSVLMSWLSRASLWSRSHAPEHHRERQPRPGAAPVVRFVGAATLDRGLQCRT